MQIIFILFLFVLKYKKQILKFFLLQHNYMSELYTISRELLQKCTIHLHLYKCHFHN